MLTSATKRKIDNARDILVGKIPMPTTQVEQITLALIYKFMSDIDKKSKALGDTSGFFANGYEKYAWDNLMDKSLPARDRVTLYSEGLEKMSKNPHIPQLFRDIFKNAFLPFRSPETLKLFLEQIDEFQYDHSEELGNAFEYLLSVMGSQGDAGQFRTPRHIIDFIVKVVDPSKTDTILDPACGTAGFLISAYKHIREKGLTAEEQKKLTDNFVGYDISHDMQRLAMVNMYLHHFPDPKIFEYDTLSSEDRWDDDFDVILANPPFMTPTGGIRPHSKFSIKSTRAEALFTSYIMEHLTNKGKAGVIVPEGIIFQSQNAYKDLRKMMIDNDYLWAVVSLPNGIFQPYSGVKTSILLFDRQLAKRTNKILFVKVESDGFDLGTQRRKIQNNDLPEMLVILNEYKQQLVDGIDPNLHDIVGVTLVEKKAVKENDYNLSAERYLVVNKPQISKYKKIKLNELFEIIRNGKNVNQADAKGGYRVTRIKTIANKVVNLDETKWTSDEVDESYFLKNGDILFSHINSFEHLAKTAIVEGLSETIIHGTNLILLRPDKKKVSPKFIAYLFKSTQFINNARAYAQKAVNQASIKVSDIKNIEVPIPPLSVQQEIAEELDRYQNIIDGAKQVLKNYRPEIKIDEAWEWVELGNVFEKSGETKNPNSHKGAVKYVGLENISQNTGKLVGITDSFFENIRSTKSVFERDSILYGKLRPNLNKVWMADFNGICSTDIFVLMAKNQDINSYLYSKYFLSDDFNKEVLRGIKGAQLPRVGWSYFSKIKIPKIPLSVQNEIAFQLKEEQEAIETTQTLITRFENKIKKIIDDIWLI